VQHIRKNTKHYSQLLCEVIDEIFKTMTPTNPELSYKDSVLDVIISQRRIRDENRATDDSEELFPPSLTRR
jgi:DNA replication licensing factor MCM7